jgi:peptidyl-prolyl cis-trans isomerase D
MLEFLRKAAAGTVAKILMGLLVLAFGIWGIGDVFRGFGSRDLARIGSTTIGIETFRQLYQERLQQLSRQLGRGLSPDQARSLGVDRELLGELMSEAALDEKTRRLGLGVSQETLLARIHADPTFKGPNGQFDPARFYDALRSAGFSEARFIDGERRLMLRQQLARALAGELKAPDVLVEAVRRYEGEERSVEFAVLGREQAGQIPAPSLVEIEAYFNERKASFRAPEYRKLVLLPLTPESLAADMQIPDAELRKAYEEMKDRLAIPERREVDQILFPALEEAAAAAKRMAEGVKFEDIVAERKLKLSDVSIGTVTKQEILDPRVADAVFALPEGKISDPIPGRFGAVIARVQKIVPGKQPAFDEIKDELRKNVAGRRARSLILDQHDKIEDERAGGLRLAEVAARLGLKAVTIDAVDRSGRDADGKVIEGVPSLDQVISEAFNTEVGVEADPIEIGNSGYVWYEVAAITPSRDRTLDEARERVRAAWYDEQITKRLTEHAEALRARLDAGETFASAAPGLKPETREKLRRAQNVDGLDRAALALIFQTPQGKAGIAPAADGVGRIVFRVTAIDVPAGAAASQRIAQLNAGLQDDILVEYVLHLQSTLGVRVNETALQTVTGASRN